MIHWFNIGKSCEIKRISMMEGKCFIDTLDDCYAFLHLKVYLNVMTDHRGSQCVAYGCRKRWHRKMEGAARSESESTDDEESVAKKKQPRTFHL